MENHEFDMPWTLIPRWLGDADSKFWMNLLTENLNWTRPIVRVYGRKHKVPRLTTFIAKEGISYFYSGVLHKAYGIPIWFQPLLLLVNQTCNTSFNGCLLNFYRNGKDKMGWHSDNESEIDSKMPIASLSLGSTRDFVLRNIESREKYVLPLASGDLLIMKPFSQEFWEHSLPARSRVKSERINLTFRCYL